MSTADILVLGAIAGLTIFLGLPLGRVRNVSPTMRASLSALATGILVFLFWDVMSNGVDPIEANIRAHSWWAFAGEAALLAGGFAAGFLSLVYYDAWMHGASARAGETSWLRSLSPGHRLAVLIATGIGLHHFGEGLAIGQSAASNEISLAVTLIIGFGLHNATEGFGICGPLSGEGIRPSWKLIAVLGVIGGGPTFLGTVVGQAWASDAVSVVFFTVAGGSILYVVQELFAVNRKYGSPVLIMWLMLFWMYRRKVFLRI